MVAQAPGEEAQAPAPALDPAPDPELQRQLEEAQARNQELEEQLEAAKVGSQWLACMWAQARPAVICMCASCERSRAFLWTVGCLGMGCTTGLNGDTIFMHGSHLCIAAAPRVTCDAVGRYQGFSRSIETTALCAATILACTQCVGSRLFCLLCVQADLQAAATAREKELQAELEEAQRKLAEAEGQLAEARERVAALEAQLAELQEKLRDKEAQAEGQREGQGGQQEEKKEPAKHEDEPKKVRVCGVWLAVRWQVG